MHKTLLQEAKDQGIKGPDGEWAWYWIPGREKYTKADLPPDASSPSASAIWPLQKRDPLLVPRFIQGKGPNSPRCLGYVRGDGNRHHAGVDLHANFGDVIVAVDSGKIVNFYYFYNGTFALFIDHGNYVVNYGEVDAFSLKKFGLVTPRFRDAPVSEGGTGKLYTSAKSDIISTSKIGGVFAVEDIVGTGSTVSAGQPIAIVGKMNKSSMLHFEMYTAGTASNKKWGGFPSQSPPSGLLNPTNFLLVLSGRKAEAQPSPKESAVSTAECR